MTSPFDSLKRWLLEAARARQLRKGRRRRQLRLESLESRTLLAADTLAAIAGTAFVDLTDNGLTADDLRLPNATVQLYRDGGDGVLDRGVGGGDDTSLGSQLTDASGRYRMPRLGPGTYVDSDGDSYTIKLSGPGTARIRLDDPDGDGRGPIESILLTGTTAKSSLSITVKKAAAGDGPGAAATTPAAAPGRPGVPARPQPETTRRR